jgi:DNA mismatch repair protein MutS2
LGQAIATEVPELADLVEIQEGLEPTKLIQFEIGEEVEVPKWKAKAIILDVKPDSIKVAMGKLQISLPPSELLKSLNPNKTKKAKKTEFKMESNAAPVSQLDLRGKLLSDAMMELERYLDQAYSSGTLAEVTIVHGLGTGALREGTRKLLAKLPYVKTYYDGGTGRGGAGATIVEF